MAKFCTECGAAMENDKAVCPNCGKIAEGFVPQSYNNGPVKEDPVGVGEWILTFIISGLPVIGFIMLIVWAFSARKTSKKNYAKATLLLMIIAFVLCVLLVGCSAILAEL